MRAGGGVRRTNASTSSAVASATSVISTAMGRDYRRACGNKAHRGPLPCLAHPSPPVSPFPPLEQDSLGEQPRRHPIRDAVAAGMRIARAAAPQRLRPPTALSPWTSNPGPPPRRPGTLPPPAPAIPGDPDANDRFSTANDRSWMVRSTAFCALRPLWRPPTTGPLSNTGGHDDSARQPSTNSRHPARPQTGPRARPGAPAGHTPAPPPADNSRPHTHAGRTHGKRHATRPAHPCPRTRQNNRSGHLDRPAETSAPTPTAQPNPDTAAACPQPPTHLGTIENPPLDGTGYPNWIGTFPPLIPAAA